MPLDFGNPLADPDEVARRVAARAWKPSPPVDFSAWAKANVVFGNESPKPGPYDPHYHPWDRHVLAALSPDHPARIVVLKGSAQTIGKTTLSNIFMGGSLDMDPGPVLFYQATDPNAVKWAKQKWKPFVRGTSSLSRLFPVDRARDGGNALLYQERGDGRGFLQISGANSAPALAQVSAPRQVHDDLAKWEMLPAGDPEYQADSRSKAFRWAKIFKIGTPLIEPGCRMTRNYQRGTRGEFHVQCPHDGCGTWQALTWTNLRPSIDAIDEARKKGIAEPTPHFTCEGCGASIEERDRRAIVGNLKVVFRNFEAGARVAVWSFYVWSAYAPAVTLTDLAEGWLAAKGDPTKEQVFYNDDLGLAYEVAGEAPPWEKLKTRAELLGLDLGRIPPGALIYMIGVDCQGDRVEWHLKGYGRDGRRWTIEYGVIPGHISEQTCRDGLDALLKRTWPNGTGRRFGADMLAIDANYSRDDVREWAKRHPQSRVIMVRGAKSEHAPDLALVKQEKDRAGKVIKYQRRFWNVGASPLKVALYANLKKDDPAQRGFCGFPAGLTDEFYQQLTAERRVAHVTRDGFTEYRWTKAKDQPNEALDTEIYATAAAIHFGWKRFTENDWDRLEADRESPPADQQLDLESLLSPVAPASAPSAGPADRATKTGARRGRAVGGVSKRKVTT